MIRKLNYTNRIKIFQEDVRISVDKNDGLFLIDADLSALSNREKYKLPPLGAVYLEAYRQSTWMRFDYGCIEKIQPPKNRALEAFDNLEGIKFRVKVTSTEGDHRLLAEADKIKLENQEEDNEDGHSLLHVVPKSDLGDEIYRVVFADPDGTPELWINDENNNYRAIGKSIEFMALALPSIFREILTRTIIVEKWTDEDDDADWRCQWIRFAKTVSFDPEIPDPENERDEAFKWIESTISRFAKKLKLRKHFRTIWSDES
jgi:hypothetical protein